MMTTMTATPLSSRNTSPVGGSPPSAGGRGGGVVVVGGGKQKPPQRRARGTVGGAGYGRTTITTATPRSSSSSTSALTFVVTTGLFVLVMTTILVHQCLWLQRALLVSSSSPPPGRPQQQQQQQHDQHWRHNNKKNERGVLHGRGRQHHPQPKEGEGEGDSRLVHPQANEEERQGIGARRGGRQRGGGAGHVLRGSTTPASSSSSSSSPLNSSSHARPVEWMQVPDFKIDPDAFSDSWWMSIDLFKPLNLTKVAAVEHACKRPLRILEPKVRMALDWFDLGVEHLSKWWKTLKAPDDTIANDRVLHYLSTYRDKALTDDIDLYEPYRHHMNTTLAIISFQPYKSRHVQHADQGQQLTIASLSATVASLIRVGMGRVLVVGYHRDDMDQQDNHLELVRASFDAVADAVARGGGVSTSNPHEQQQQQQGRRARETLSMHVVLGCELAYVTATPEHVRTPAMAAFLREGEVNVPRGALVGMQVALAGTNKLWTHQWLGHPDVDHHPWEHLYLTEPDTLLLTRPTTVPHLRRMLDDQLVLAPHRFQPIPYQRDVPESNRTESYITVDAWNALDRPILALDSMVEGHVCCDEQAYWYRPGNDPHWHDRCNDAWWRCGFSTSEGDHSRVLDHYHLMRPLHGTGITTLAGSGHGRRCIPSQNATCARKRSVNHPDHPDNPWIEAYRRRAAPVAASSE